MSQDFGKWNVEPTSNPRTLKSPATTDFNILLYGSGSAKLGIIMKKWLMIGFVLCCASGSGWWLWAESQPDPQVEEVKSLIPNDISKIPADKRRETFAKVREKMEQLTPRAT